MAEPVTDEMTAVRRLRADAPVPDHARLTPARQRLLDEIAAPRRGPVVGWKLKALGSVAAVVAAALLSTLVLRQDHTEPAEPAATPRADQWVYQQIRVDTLNCGPAWSTELYSEAGVLMLSPGPRSCTLEPAKQIATDQWVRYDGRYQALPKHGADDPHDVGMREGPGVPAGTMLPPRETDALVAALPDTPEAALKLILKRSIPTRASHAHLLTQAQRDFKEVVEVLSGASYVPADKARTLYRIITSLEGATKPAKTTDGAGRTVLAIGIDGNFRDYAWERNSMQVLLDPETYAYRGVRSVAALDYYVGGKPSTGPFVAKGTVIGTATRLATVVVDKAGER
ncbi:hypothetical protein ACFW2D_37275 [Streptomyces sp. NPDC058914]|uniref:hypothetical protein n=1 Tax=Streptomyces sp. NPDC058914 TaxID=3346671 RepID=UPI0036818D32